MKTFFTEDELKAFVRKKIAQLEGSNILLAASRDDFKIDIDDSEKGDIKAIATKAADKFLQMGREAGYIQGQMDFLKEFNNLIEI